MADVAVAMASGCSGDHDQWQEIVKAQSDRVLSRALCRYSAGSELGRVFGPKRGRTVLEAHRVFWKIYS